MKVQSYLIGSIREARMKKPLDGIRVIDMSHVIAGPFASLYLAQLGAEVIKIEPPVNGDVMRTSGINASNGVSNGFTALNAGKRSLAIDIHFPEGSEAIKKLAKSSDVFIENFKPGVVSKYGLDFDSIKKINENIIYCSISGYGQTGAWSERGAYDHVMQAMTGMMLMSGSAENAEPIKVGFPLIDGAAGIVAALAILAAIAGRANNNNAQYIDSSMLEASLTLMYPSASAYLTDGIEPQRLGNRGYTGSPTADTYKCHDGWLAVGANTPKQFRKFSEILDLSYLCSDENIIDLEAFNSPGSAFVIAKNYLYIKHKFQEALALKSAYEMEVVLNQNAVPAARVRTLGEFLEELAKGKSNWYPTIFNSGFTDVRTTGLGFKNTQDKEDENENKFAPTLGQDNDEILKELGYSISYINNLRKNGIVS